MMKPEIKTIIKAYGPDGKEIKVTPEMMRRMSGMLRGRCPKNKKDWKRSLLAENKPIGMPSVPTLGPELDPTPVPMPEGRCPMRGMRRRMIRRPARPVRTRKAMRIEGAELTELMKNPAIRKKIQEALNSGKGGIEIDLLKNTVVKYVAAKKVVAPKPKPAPKPEKTPIPEGKAPEKKCGNN